MIGLAEEIKHYESISVELDELRRLSLEFIVKRMRLKRMEAEIRVNEASLAWNIIRDYFRWSRRSDEYFRPPSTSDEEGSTG